MSALAADLIADCPDAVVVTFNGVTTPGLWLQRIQTEDASGHLNVLATAEHLVIETNSLPGLARKSTLSFQENEDYGGATHTRRVTEIRPKDDDRILTRLFLELV